MTRVAAPALLVSTECPRCGTTPPTALDGHPVDGPPPELDIGPDDGFPELMGPVTYRFTHHVPATVGRVTYWQAHVWDAHTFTMSRVLALHVEVL